MLKARQKIGKYRIQRRIARGGFADVYRARDTIEGIEVALKIPRPEFVSEEALSDFRREVRLTAGLQHENILRIKDANFIGKEFVIASPLGQGTLDDRLKKRLSLAQALDYSEQLLEALSYAHSKRIIHCDVKPDNLVLFEGGLLRLTDFGISKVAAKTMQASGSGTVGYVAPEQALGKPSQRSDVFSAGLLIYRMISGCLPEWPFDWPPPGLDRARKRVSDDMITLLRRAMQVDHRKRYRDGAAMLEAWKRIAQKERTPKPAARSKNGVQKKPRSDWKTIRTRQFQRTYGKQLGTQDSCDGCGGPVAMPMAACPWCGRRRDTHRADSKFPAECPRCKRGVKLDWHYCAWCYGPKIGPESDREYSDKRYTARDTDTKAWRRDLMPFMRYSPWTRKRVAKAWKIPTERDTCGSCGWGVLREFWDHCPWCAKGLARKR